MALSPIKPRPGVPGDQERYLRDLEHKRLNPIKWACQPMGHGDVIQVEVPVEVPVEEKDLDLSDMTKDELFEVARSLGVQSSKRWVKTRIIAEIEAFQKQ